MQTAFDQGLAYILGPVIDFLGTDLFAILAGVIVALGFAQINALFLVWLERKLAGHFQLRPGPKEHGPFGLLQTILDGVKLLVKDLIRPRDVDWPMYALAPVLLLAPPLVAFIVLPFGPLMIIRDMNIGFLLIFAFGSLTVLSLLMGGFASNNKYSLMGAYRSVSQIIAYEVPLLLATMNIVLMTGSFSMTAIVDAQSHGLWNVIFQPVAALVFFTCALAETNRAPFDIPEAESELIAGFHTEYPGMRFGLFFLAEYTNMFIVSAVAVTLFFGGWRGPVLPGFVWFLIKTYILIFVMMWARWTFPRLRFDQLMNFAWKLLIPVTMINVVVTAVVIKLVR